MPSPPLDQLKQLADQVTPVSIPECYQWPEFRFCRVGFHLRTLVKEIGRIEGISDVEKALQDAENALKNLKVPRGKAWQRAKTDADGPEIEGWHTHDSAKLQLWLKAGGNYGVCAGSEWVHEGQAVRLYLHDADEVKHWQDAGFFDDLPAQTRAVQSSAENKRHYYFLTDLQSTKAHEELPGLGHFKFYASQVVGPGSLHPSGVRYLLIDESAPAYVDAETLAAACIKATKNLMPEKVAAVKAMVGAKTNHAGQFKEKVEALESKLKKAKVDRIKKIQQQEAQSEAAYNAAKSDNTKDQSNPDKAGIKPLDDLISRIDKDERINLCLRKLNASIPKLHRFEKAVSYKGKVGEGEHFLRRAWATALIKSGYSDAEIQIMAAGFDDYSESRTQQQLDSVRSWVNDGGNFYPCGEIRAFIPPELCQGCRWTPPKHAAQDRDDTTQADTEIFDAVKRAGDNILRRGNVLKFVLQQYHKNHVGDAVAGKVLTLSYLSGSSLTSNGIQPGISGDAQTGKSDAMDAALHILPQEWVMRTGLSDKAAAYIDFTPGQVVHSDDLKWTDGLIYMLKVSMSHFQVGAEYTTVMKVGGKLKAVPLTIPPRMLWWITGADAAPDDQIESRQYPVDVDQTKIHACKVRDAIASRRSSRKPKFHVDKGILICRYILDQVRQSGPFSVEIPYSKWIDYKVPEDYRGQQQFFDLIDALAILNFRQRKVIDGWIQADLQDFSEAKTIFTSKNESHNTGLSTAELQLVRVMVGKGPCTQADLVTWIGKSQSTIAKRLQSIMGKTAYITATKDRGETVYRTNKVDMSVFGNVIVGWKKDIPTHTTMTSLSSL